MSALAKLDHDRIVSRQRTLDELRRARVTLEQRGGNSTTFALKAERAEAALARTPKSRNDLVHDIDSRRDLNAQLVGELQAANQKLQVDTARPRKRVGRRGNAAAPSVPWRSRLAGGVERGSPLGALCQFALRQLGSKSTRRKGRPSPPSMTASSHTPMPSAASATS